MSCCHRSDSNWLRWLLVMDIGTPKRAIQPVRKACATDVAVTSVNGTTSGQRVKRWKRSDKINVYMSGSFVQRGKLADGG